MNYYEQVEDLRQQIVTKFAPEKIYLFGSGAKGIIRESSDIDLCIIKNVAKPKQFKVDLQLNLDSEIPFDIIVYTPESWSKHSNDATSFAYLIKTKGVKLYG